MKKQALVLLCATLTSTTFIACGDVEEKPGTTTSASSSSGASSVASSSSSSSGETGGAGGMGGAGGAGGMGGAASSSSSSSSGTSSSSTSSTSSASSSSGSGEPMINGCTLGTAEDNTAMTTVTIQFAGLSYTPSCIRVKAETKVTFEGNFGSHPLEGGTVTNNVPKADPTSPITLTNTGTSATFTLSNAGTVPYYCTFHASGGMMGAIFVEP